MINCDLHKHQNNRTGSNDLEERRDVSQGRAESVTRPEFLIKDTGTIMLNVTSPRELIKGETEKTKNTQSA